MPHDDEPHAVAREEVQAAYPEFVAALARDAINEERARIRKILAITPMRGA
jgi:hypothetical protein